MVERSNVNLENFIFKNTLEFFFEICDRRLLAANSLIFINYRSADLCSHNFKVILLKFSRNVKASICQHKLRIIENSKEVNWCEAKLLYRNTSCSLRFTCLLHLNVWVSNYVKMLNYLMALQVLY
jgi:hypothetical protein